MISYDPAAQLLYVAPRSTVDAWHALQTSAALGAAFWIVLIVATAALLAAARRDLGDRHALALALWTAALGGWALRTARYAPIVSGDELVDYAQSALGVFTGLRPVELIFPTGWTQLVAIAMAPGVWLGMPAGVAADDPALAAHLGRALLDAAPLGLVVSRWLSTAALIALAVAMARALTLRAGAAAGIYAVAALLTSPHLQPLAARCSPHIPAVALAWTAVLLLALGDPRRKRWAAAAALAMGYAMGSHGLAALLCAAAAPLWWRHRRSWHIGVAALVAGVLVSNPHLFEHWAAYAANVRFRLGLIAAPEDVMDAPTSNYLANLMTSPILLVGLVMWAVAMPMERRLRRWDTLGPAVTGLLMLAMLSAVETRFDRYLAWALPGLVWAAAQGFGGIVRRLKSPKIDALAAGALATVSLALYAVPVASAPCPSGLDGERPLAEIAVLRSNGPMVLVTQMPQLGRAVAAGLLAAELEEALLAELARRLGGRARVELRAFHLSRALPRSYVALPQAATKGDVAAGAASGDAELWELRWRRAMPIAAPLHVAGLPPLEPHHHQARCGMLLRVATLPAPAAVAPPAERSVRLPAAATPPSSSSPLPRPGEEPVAD